MEMLREKIRALEHKIIEMIRNGQENVAIADRLHRWTRAIMLTHNPGDLPQVLVSELQHEFLIPQAGIQCLLRGELLKHEVRISLQLFSQPQDILRRV